METGVKRLFTVALLFVVILFGGIIIKELTTADKGVPPLPMYSDIIDRNIEEKELPRALIYAIIKTESDFTPTAESNIGARGLMQLTKDTFDWINYRRGETGASWDDMYDPEINVDYGTFLVSQLINEFGDTKNVLAAYHAGWNAVKKWLDDPEISPDGATLESIPYSDTAYYVKKVMGAMEDYKAIYGME